MTRITELLDIVDVVRNEFGRRRRRRWAPPLLIIDGPHGKTIKNAFGKHNNDSVAPRTERSDDAADSCQDGPHVDIVGAFKLNLAVAAAAADNRLTSREDD